MSQPKEHAQRLSGFTEKTDELLFNFYSLLSFFAEEKGYNRHYPRQQTKRLATKNRKNMVKKNMEKRTDESDEQKIVNDNNKKRKAEKNRDE